ncbi:hypothetical protein MHTCC0001_28810 [Flavobacteriaceae bacterium MHTCC 0001]
MVTIVNFKERQREDGTEFFVLELQGGIEMVKSKETGNFYATAKRTFLPSTFTREVCESLIGTQMPGGIVKEACEPFDYVVKETGEEITLNHRWVYKSEEELTKTKATALPEQNVIANSDVFSKNGILEPAM